MLAAPLIAILAMAHALFLNAWNLGWIPVGATTSTADPYPIFTAEKTWIEQPDDYTLTQTAAAAIALPDIGYRLVRVRVTSATVPGYLAITYDGISKAYFPAYSNATSGSQAWALTWSFQGNNLPAGLFTWQAGVTSITFTFSKGKSRGPDVSAYRAIIFVQTLANHAAVTAMTSNPVTYDVGPAYPTKAIFLSTIAGAAFYWPQIGTAQSGGPADDQPSSITVHPAPPLPKSTQLSCYYTAPGAGAALLVVYYRPAQ